MASFAYTIYKNSVLATIISFLSGIFAVMGLLMAVMGVKEGQFALVGMGIVMAVVIGFGGNMLARKINDSRSNVKWWKNAVRKAGWEEKIPNSEEVCFKVYNANPNAWTLKKLQKLNPAAAEQIRQSLAENSKTETSVKGGCFAKKIVVAILAIFVLLAGYGLYQKSAAPKQTEVFGLSDYAYSELESGKFYRMDDVTVVDNFAKQTQKVDGKVTSTTAYYLVTYRDTENRLVAAPLAVEDKDSISYMLYAYASDYSQNIGDCCINGYVKTHGLISSDLRQYFDEAVDKYGLALEEYLVKTDYLLDYDGGTNPLA